MRRNWTALFLTFMLVCSLRGKAADRFVKPRPVELTREGRQWASRTLKKLTLEEKVGQMLSVRYFMDFENFDGDAYRQFRDQMQKYGIGSVLLTVHVDSAGLLKNAPLEAAAMSNRLQKDSKLPLLIAGDLERGLATRMNSVPIFPDPMAFGATGNPAYVERFGAIVGAESRAVGIHWNFYPIADVNSNPGNPIINTRSFGEDPATVGDLVAAYIRGARSQGMLTTVKHFPGHGDTGTDSHLGVARVESDKEHLNKIELPPFQKAIEAGVDSVMVAHVTVPALEPDPNKVATTSSNVIQKVLRQDLGFKNLVVTDALEMQGLTTLYPPQQGNPAGRAAVDAIKAGNDVLLLPTDLDGAFRGVMEAVHRGEIQESRIDESVQRILEMKAAVDLHKARLVDMEQVSYLVSRQQDLQLAQQVADDAVTVVRENHMVLPLTRFQAPKIEGEIYPAPVQPTSQVVAVIFSDNAHGSWGRGFESGLKARRADATVFYVDSSMAAALSGVVLQAVKDAGKVVVAGYLSPIAGKQVMPPAMPPNGHLKNSIALDQPDSALLNEILAIAANKTVVVALGSPYLAQGFPQIQNYVCTFSNASTAESSAVRFLFGELKAKGRLPVTLPGIAERGVGLASQTPAKSQ
jgi:beta-N-acetylhexosaminidase